jgi:hypothetical protein
VWRSERRPAGGPRSARTAGPALALVAALVAAFAFASTGAPPAGAAPDEQTGSVVGAVVALRGTGHVWILDDIGLLHWVGDTRALVDRQVNWGTRFDVTLDQLVTAPRGAPWLSADLVKIGSDIYVPKWETNAARPILQRLQSPNDLELIGVDGTNYGGLVLEQREWEQRYGLSVGGLTRTDLDPAVPPQAPAATPTAPPDGPRLIVPSQEVIRGRGDSELVAWLVGEVRNEGREESCGLGVLAFFFAPSNALVGFGGMETRRRMPAGAVWPYKITLRWLPSYAHLEVRAFPNTTSACPAEPLKVSDLDVQRVENEAQRTFSYRATGTVTNPEGRPVINARLSVWFVDAGGRVIDVVDPERGVRPRTDRLQAGQSTAFDAESESSQANGAIQNIKGVRAVAFGEGVARLQD